MSSTIGGMIAQSVEPATSGKEDVGSIPALGTQLTKRNVLSFIFDDFKSQIKLLSFRYSSSCK